MNGIYSVVQDTNSDSKITTFIIKVKWGECQGSPKVRLGTLRYSPTDIKTPLVERRREFVHDHLYEQINLSRCSHNEL